MAAGSKRVIYAALVGNGLIAVTKFVAASITGSSAMLAEGIHSLVDTGNQVLLLHGLRRSKRPADAAHPFGYGAELYFWAFVVAILIFAVGSGVSLYEGVHKVMHPHAIENAYVNYIVLAFAMVFEGFAWWIAYKEFDSRRGNRTLVAAVRDSKDPTVFTVLFEDTAAMLGLIVAFAGIWVAQTYDLPIFDGIATIGIGLILGVTAILLAIETKGLLIGEAADPVMVADIRSLIAHTPEIRALNEVRTLHRGPDDILLAISVDFEDELTAGRVEETIYRLELEIKHRFPLVRRLFIEVQSAAHHDDMLARAKLYDETPPDRKGPSQSS